MPLPATRYLAEQIFRLSRAAQQGRALREEFRLPPLGEAEEEPGVAPALVPHLGAADAVRAAAQAAKAGSWSGRSTR